MARRSLHSPNHHRFFICSEEDVIDYSDARWQHSLDVQGALLLGSPSAGIGCGQCGQGSTDTSNFICQSSECSKRGVA